MGFPDNAAKTKNGMKMSMKGPNETLIFQHEERVMVRVASSQLFPEIPSSQEHPQFPGVLCHKIIGCRPPY